MKDMQPLEADWLFAGEMKPESETILSRWSKGKGAPPNDGPLVVRPSRFSHEEDAVERLIATWISSPGWSQSAALPLEMNSAAVSEPILGVTSGFIAPRSATSEAERTLIDFPATLSPATPFAAAAVAGISAVVLPVPAEPVSPRATTAGSGPGAGQSLLKAGESQPAEIETTVSPGAFRGDLSPQEGGQSLSSLSFTSPQSISISAGIQPAVAEMHFPSSSSSRLTKSEGTPPPFPSGSSSEAEPILDNPVVRDVAPAAGLKAGSSSGDVLKHSSVESVEPVQLPEGAFSDPSQPLVKGESISSVEAVSVREAEVADTVSAAALSMDGLMVTGHASAVSMEAGRSRPASSLAAPSRAQPDQQPESTVADVPAESVIVPSLREVSRMMPGPQMVQTGSLPGDREDAPAFEESNVHAVASEASLLTAQRGLPSALSDRPMGSEPIHHLEQKTIDQLVASTLVESHLVEDNGNQKFHLRLDPPDLGGITVEIHRNSMGHVSLHISAASAETHALLEQHAPEITQALQDQGLPLSEFDLSQHQHQGHSSGDMNHYQEQLENSRLIREARENFRPAENPSQPQASERFSFRA